MDKFIELIELVFTEKLKPNYWQWETKQIFNIAEVSFFIKDDLICKLILPDEFINFYSQTYQLIGALINKLYTELEQFLSIILWKKRCRFKHSWHLSDATAQERVKTAWGNNLS